MLALLLSPAVAAAQVPYRTVVIFGDTQTTAKGDPNQYADFTSQIRLIHLRVQLGVRLMPRNTATPNAASTSTLLRKLFDEEILVASSPLVFGEDDLTPGERQLVAKAVVSRRCEFSTGRVLARGLLRELGSETAELLRDSDRVPIWPEGVVGSISHCDDLCAVAIGDRARFRGVGLDVEPDEPVKEGVERVVCGPGESAWLDLAKGEERSRRIKMVFSIKEAVYKAFYPELRAFWGFQDVQTEIDLEGERFRASLPEGPEVREIEGRVVRRQGWILSAVTRRRT